jgi:hypothetical protein
MCAVAVSPRLLTKVSTPTQSSQLKRLSSEGLEMR